MYSTEELGLLRTLAQRAVIMPCGRCRQLLWENGGAELLLWTVSGVRPMTDVLPDAFGPEDLEKHG